MFTEVNQAQKKKTELFNRKRASQFTTITNDINLYCGRSIT